MDNYNNEDMTPNSDDLQNDWQNAENQQHKHAENEEHDYRTAEAGGYGLDRENAFDATASDKDREDDDDEDEDEDNDDTDDSDDMTIDDWGDIDPAGGDAPSSPGSAI